MKGYVPFTPDQILLEDNHLLIINKKSGQIVQGDKTETPSLIEDIKSYIKKKHKKEGNVYLGAPHRIDRPTTGIVVFAKTSKALSRMTALFKKREIDKHYWAMVRNPVQNSEATLTHYLKKNERNNKSTTYPRETEGAKKAVLSYTTLETLDHYSLIEVQLETGRHHQIRAQLSFQGNPIKGDVKYGDLRGNKDRSIALHARSIAFIHPVSKKEIAINAPINSSERIWQVSKVIQKESAI